jgi:hypothetical protein
MPTTHKISWATHEAAGININQYKKDVFDKTGVQPTHEQVQQFILSHYTDFFDEEKKEKKTNKKNNEQNDHSKPRSNSSDSGHVYKNPIRVRCGYKRMEHEAFELIGPGIHTKEGQVYVEWAISGLKEYVPEVDVVRGELPSRSRTKTNRYEPPDEDDSNRKPRAKKKLPLPTSDTHFLPIKDGHQDPDKLFDECSTDSDES